MDFHCYTYLYIEDDTLSQQVMEMLMRRAMGIEQLTIFSDTADLSHRLMALDQPPDLILLDVNVQPLNGFEALAIIRQQAAYAHSRVIAVTASVMNEEVDRLRQSGFDGAVGKPLSVQTFPQLVARILAGEEIWHIP